MADVVTIGSLANSGGAIAFAALTWLESRRQRKLLETMTKSLRSSPSPVEGQPQRQPARPINSRRAEERRRLRLDLEREKHEWRKNRDIAKALGWFLDPHERRRVRVTS